MSKVLKQIQEIHSERFESEIPEDWAISRVDDVIYVTDYVANGSFASLKKNVTYLDEPNYAILVRFTDYVKGWNGNYKYVNEHAYKFLSKSSVEHGDIVIANVGDPGKLFIVPKMNISMTLGPNSVLVRTLDSNVLTTNFVAYFYQSAWGKDLISQITTGTAQQKFNKTGFRSTYIPIAPLDQQKQIVEKIEQLFSHIDAGIEALNTAKQRLKQYRQSVLKAAVTGELTKEWREANKSKLEPANQLFERILQARRQKWEEQQLEQLEAKGKLPKNNKWKEKYKEPVSLGSDINIPESWIGVTTDQVFYYVTSGSRGWAKYYSDDGSLFLRMGNLEHYDVKLDLDKIQRVSPPEGTEGSRTKVMAGDSLISITADVGMVGIVPDGFEEAYINQHIALARPALEGMSLYLAWLLSGDFVKEQFKTLQRGATKVGLGLDDIKAIQFGLPSIKEQHEIVKRIEVKLNTIDRLNKEIDIQLLKAEKNKQSILASAFSGKLIGPKASTNVVPFPQVIAGISETDVHAGIIALSIKAHSNNTKSKNTLGHVKCEKISHLVESHLGISLGRNPYKDAAGPNDYQHLHKVNSRGKKSNWFEAKTMSGNRHKYVAKKGMDILLIRINKKMGDQVLSIDKLINLFVPLKTEQAEIVATLYAGWNNLLLDGGQPLDEDIVYESRENWHQSKLKIDRDRFFKALDWMRKNELVPKGQGEKVNKKK